MIEIVRSSETTTPSQRRRILLVIDTLATGGAESSLLEIASGLRNFVPVVCVLFDKNADLKLKFKALNIHVVFLRTEERWWWIDGARKLRRLIREVRPELIHATLYKSELVTRLTVFGRGLPHIGSFVNDSYSPNRYKEQTAFRNFKLNIVRFFDALTARSVTHFMSITESIADSNARALMLRKDKTTTIYRGRKIGRYPVSHPSRDVTPFSFIIVARLITRKGHIQLFEAARILAERGFEFKLRLAGDGVDHKKFIDKVVELKIDGMVEFLGNRDDVPELLASSHCFVFPSHYEGQGGSLVEAMMAAKPIVASDIPVFREQITDGKTGVLFRVFDSGDLAVKMEWMMNNYERAVEIGLAARSEAVERFNIERTVRLHEELYERVITEHRGSRS